MIPTAVQEWCQAHGLGAVRQVGLAGGGCINNGAHLQAADGAHLFLKTNAHCPPDMFACEAAGLAALQQAGALRVPQVFLHGADFILLEDLQPAAPARGYWAAFGAALAQLHQVAADRFGFAGANYIGSTPQPNPWTADGYVFFAEQRLGFQADLAHRRGLLGSADLRRVTRLGERLPDLIPPQSPSLIHGDLWSGNALTDALGAPALIDPAAHFGWAEAELGMTALFGGFPGAFYDAYQAVRPLPPGFDQRLPVYNLYHLLNHLNLFGGSYLHQVQAILRRFV